MRDNSILLKLAKTIFRLLASLKLAVTLIVLLAAILAAATFVESDKGRDYARWYFYTQTWFVALLGMLGVNILSATLIRFPWKLRQFGFVVTHAGLLVLLAGSIVTFNYGVDATISLEEGETSDHVTVRDLNRFSVQWRPIAGQPDRPVSQFIFTPGPVDWPEGKSLLLGEINDVKLRVTRYLAHARPSEEWMADPDGNGVAAMKFSLVGPDNTENAEQWLTATPLRRQHGRRFGEGGIPAGRSRHHGRRLRQSPGERRSRSPGPADDSLRRPRDPPAREQEHRQEDPRWRAATFPSRSPSTCPMPGSRPTAAS